MEIKYVVAEFLKDSADKIMKNECGLDDNEILYLAS
jgi:hypothetical protein